MTSNARRATLLALTGVLMTAPAAFAVDAHAGHNHATPTKPAVKKVLKTQAPAKKVVYVCPMHPNVTSTNAKARCPECGMFLEKKK